MHHKRQETLTPESFSRCVVLLFLLWSDTVTRQHLPLWNPQLLLDANYCKLQIVIQIRPTNWGFVLNLIFVLPSLNLWGFFCRRWCLVATSLLMDSSVCTTCVLTHSSSASVSRCLQFTEYLLYMCYIDTGTHGEPLIE